VWVTVQKVRNVMRKRSWTRTIVLDGDGLARGNDGVGLGVGSGPGNVFDLDTSEVWGRAVGRRDGEGIGGEFVQGATGVVQNLESEVTSVLDSGNQLEVVDAVNRGWA